MGGQREGELGCFVITLLCPFLLVYVTACLLLDLIDIFFGDIDDAL